jgi:hypothetical protein
MTLPLGNKDITEIVGLQGCCVKEVQPTAEGHEVWVELPKRADQPVCGQETDALHQRMKEASPGCCVASLAGSGCGCG